jgi:hypothetical protein
MYKKTIFLYGGKGLQKRGSTLYNRKKVAKPALKGLDNYLLSMIKGVSLQSKLNKAAKQGGAVKKDYGGGGLKFVR